MAKTLTITEEELRALVREELEIQQLSYRDLIIAYDIGNQSLSTAVRTAIMESNGKRFTNSVYHLRLPIPVLRDIELVPLIAKIVEACEGALSKEGNVWVVLIVPMNGTMFRYELFSKVDGETREPLRDF